MTKTLTEQWREGTLRGCFYWKLPNGNICTAYTDTMRDIKKVSDSDEVEVLQETPSYVEYNELLKKIDELEKKLNKAEDAIREAYWKCENCYKGVCQYCLNSGVKCYMQGNKVESVGKLKEKLDIATKALKEYADRENYHDFDDDYDEPIWNIGSPIMHAELALKEMEGVK